MEKEIAEVKSLIDVWRMTVVVRMAGVEKMRKVGTMADM